MRLYHRYLFPRICNLLMASPLVTKERGKTLAGVRGEVLEIGFGTGLNLPHYPPGVKHLTTIDANPGMARLARERIRRSPFPVECELRDGAQLALDSDRFDSVVSTWTLCSIRQVEAALREIYRVLKPGGRFFFVEHGLSPDPGVRRWQDRLQPLHQRIADGCRLNRNIELLVEQGNLEIIDLEKFYLAETPRFLGFTYRGTGRK